jgi:hypothetical protein
MFPSCSRCQLLPVNDDRMSLLSGHRGAQPRGSLRAWVQACQMRTPDTALSTPSCSTERMAASASITATSTSSFSLLLNGCTHADCSHECACCSGNYRPVSQVKANPGFMAGITQHRGRHSAWTRKESACEEEKGKRFGRCFWYVCVRARGGSRPRESRAQAAAQQGRQHNNEAVLGKAVDLDLNLLCTTLSCDRVHATSSLNYIIAVQQQQQHRQQPRVAARTAGESRMQRKLHSTQHLVHRMRVRVCMCVWRDWGWGRTCKT